jgi:hypothetical protein
MTTYLGCHRHHPSPFPSSMPERYNLRTRVEKKKDQEKKAQSAVHKKPKQQQTKSAMEVAAKKFFQSTYYAVAGASQDTSKFGYKRTSTPFPIPAPHRY